MTDQKPKNQKREHNSRKLRLSGPKDLAETIKTVTCKVKQRFSVTVVYKKMYQVYIFNKISHVRNQNTTL